MAQKPELILSKKEARELAVIASGLDEKRSRQVNSSDLYSLLRHLGMIQLDTISVVSRSHETVIFSRLGPYNMDLWPELFKIGAVTEYLAHAAAIVPVMYLPLMRPMMDRYRAETRAWLKESGQEALAETVLERIRKEGALSSRHFEAPDADDEASTGWYGRKPERRILANLWYGGELLIRMRERSFVRWFDLAHRVSSAVQDRLNPWETQMLPVRIAMGALGVGHPAWVTDYWRTGGVAYVPNRDVRKILNQMSDTGEIVPFTLVGESDVFYLDSMLLSVLDDLRNGHRKLMRTTFLSPFDNLIWNRNRMKVLWDMDYTLEIYTPAAKRKYGYYTMPILHRGALVGRIDPVIDRKTGVLTIRALHLEPGVKETKHLNRGIEKALDSFTKFLGGKQWQILREE